MQQPSKLEASSS